MSKHKITAGVVSQEMISDGIYSLWIEAAPIAADAVPGQFISLYCAEGTRLLPRPISLCEIDKENGRLHLVYRVAGKGTEELSALKAGVFRITAHKLINTSCSIHQFLFSGKERM